MYCQANLQNSGNHSERIHVGIQIHGGYEKVSHEQTETVYKTFTTFKELADAFASIAEKINDVKESTIQMENGKEEIRKTIRNISAVTEGTAASSQEVAATLQLQLKTIEDMKFASQSLDDLVQELDKKVKKYKIR